MSVVGATAGFLLALAMLPGQGGSPDREPPGQDPTEVLDGLLSGLGTFREVTGAELQGEVAEVGGVAFRRDVPLAFMTRDDLARFLREMFDEEYPEEKARADQRMLVAFDLLAPEADLRKLRWKLLEENVAGFYDERPGRKQLYAISPDRRLTPANQLILSHELRHALQDQYADVHGMLPDSVSDFDDRRLAFLSLLEGDATFVMERFLLHRLGADKEGGPDPSGFALPAPPLPETAPVLRDQLLMPYIVGRSLAAAVWRQGGWAALRQAWTRPPASTEQVLHPEKFLRREAPRQAEVGYEPKGGRVIQEGVLGELLTRTLLGEGWESAAAGWGGDQYRVWDLSGKSLLVWRSLWDTTTDKLEFVAAARKTFASRRGDGSRRRGFMVFGGPDGWAYAWGEQPDGVIFVSSDSSDALEAALKALEMSLLPFSATHERRENGRVCGRRFGPPLTSTGVGRDNPRAQPGLR